MEEKENSDTMDAAEKYTLNHFSHQHPLESTVSLSTDNMTCYGCNLKISPGKDYYYCKKCSFSLHRICSNMPRKTRHPSHPNHYLTLLVSSPSANTTSKCKACGHYVSGFYYDCAECSVYYHIICLALPFSVAISSHPHTLKIEFSPPYDFSCDLCEKPSHLGWLYRCRFCEFDAHISCAILDHKAQPVPPSDTLTRQIIYSSASIMEANRMIDYGIESSELMQLVVQGVGHGSAAAGWDERLRSPKENNGEIGHFMLHQSEPQMSSTSASPLNKDDPTNPSYQFSDMCFSIDLLKSYASQDHRSSPENKQFEAKINGVDHPIRPIFNPLYKVPENWLNDEYLLNGANEDKSKINRTGSKPMIQDQTTENSRCSCWRKLLVCCYTRRYKKCSKSFKNGGL